MTTLTPTTSTIHRFEAAGLGIAPFRVQRVTESIHTVPGCAPRAGSTCDYCGQAIRYVAIIRGADGAEFKVGCDCATKVGDAGNIRAISEFQRQLSAKKAVVRKARERCKILAAIWAFGEDRSLGSDTPHPRGFSGLTQRDAWGWTFYNAGHTGCYKAAREILKTLCH